MEKIIPTCRYHGIPLTKSVPVGGVKKFGIPVPMTDGEMFVGNLYFCPTCGYTEFFDDDPAASFANSEAKKT